MGDLRSLSSLVNAEPSNENLAQIEKAINLDAVLSYMAASHYIDNTDGLSNNYYLSRTRQNPRFTFIPWDLDKTLMSLNATAADDFFIRNRMMWRLYNEDDFYRAKYEAIYNDIAVKASPELLNAFVDDLVEKLNNAFEADPYLSGTGISLQKYGETLKDLFSKQYAILNTNR